MIAGATGMNIVVPKPRDMFELPPGQCRIAFSKQGSVEHLFVRSPLRIGLNIKLLQRRPVAEESVTAVTRGEAVLQQHRRSDEHTSELQSLMRISNAVFCLTNKN